jgi:hypothetical protein
MSDVLYPREDIRRWLEESLARVPDPLQQLVDALANNQKIQAIKIYRDVTKCGLKEAKDAVEQFQARLAEKYPEQFKQSGIGCATLLILCMLGWATILWIR